MPKTGRPYGSTARGALLTTYYYSFPVLRGGCPICRQTREGPASPNRRTGRLPAAAKCDSPFFSSHLCPYSGRKEPTLHSTVGSLNGSSRPESIISAQSIMLVSFITALAFLSFLTPVHGAVPPNKAYEVFTDISSTTIFAAPVGPGAAGLGYDTVDAAQTNGEFLCSATSNCLGYLVGLEAGRKWYL